jgi:cobalt-zinc-cadmium efflux system protein
VGLTLAFVALEAVGGWFANSLALLTDAAHNASDAFALGLSWWALRLSLRPADNARTYGYHRAGILVALVNAATLIAISLVIAFEALRRLTAPPEVQEQTVVALGLVGFVLNAAIAWSLRRASEKDVNVRSAFVHLAGEAVSTLGVVAAGLGMAVFHWNWLDPLASLGIAALIVVSAWGIVRETLDILLEGTPRDVDVDAMVRDILSVEGVRGVHDLHVWSISSSVRALSAHVLTDNITLAAGAAVQRDINALLLTRYGIGHAALQLECVGCEPDLLYCELTPAPERNPDPERVR